VKTLKQKVAIVGGSGFVGFSLAKHLSSTFNVKILDIKEPADLPNNILFNRCDIRKYSNVKQALNDVDLVINTAIVQIPLINENKRLAYEVNLLGTINVCRAVEESPSVEGMLLSGTWHTVGERELNGIIDEEFGFRPDKVEDRARLYALSKMGQEAIVRFHSEMSEKTFGIIRMGTVLGDEMPEKTAANVFITKGLRGEPITPYKHSMYRPMLYVDVSDVCKIYEKFAKKILKNNVEKTGNSLSNIVNVYYPKPVTIMELAKIVRDSIIKHTNWEVTPKIKVVNQNKPLLFKENDKDKLRVDITKAKEMFELEDFISTSESIMRIVKARTLFHGKTKKKTALVKLHST
jgi:nucleoside-diphosphate-sugar epimerase